MPSPLTQADLYFYPAAVSIGSTARHIHHAQASHSIGARLRSIDADAAYVTAQKHSTDLPLIANERCGSWYVPPPLKTGSVYFKSTDGHFGQWSFSLRRLNLHLLPLIGEHGGYAPDAIAKTIPIWCAVLNALLFPHHACSQAVKLHSRLSSDSERTQIQSRIPHFVAQAESLDLDPEKLRAQLRKPLDPQWMIRSLKSGSLGHSDERSGSTNSIYLCMASHYSERPDDHEYIQGAGDDSETWAKGLTPELFWANSALLLGEEECDLPNVISSIKTNPSAGAHPRELVTQVSNKPCVFVGSLGSTTVIAPEAAQILIGPSKATKGQDATGGDAPILHLRCAKGKQGSRDLRRELTKLSDFLPLLREHQPIAVLCPTGKDLSVGVALAVLCKWQAAADSAQRLSIDLDCDEQIESPHVDKTTIKRELARITVRLPAANPSRATLNAVNAFLMSGPL
ncbi:MAG: hypothetical protein Q9159_004996 [Coniocarpon cinnabarinum]